jgi:hypothetical protein
MVLLVKDRQTKTVATVWCTCGRRVMTGSLNCNGTCSEITSTYNPASYSRVNMVAALVV